VKKSFIYILFLVSTISFSQVEKETYDVISKVFLKNYNEVNYEAIFNMFDANMKNVLPLEKTNLFFAGIYERSGKIKEMNFSELKNTANIYKTKFDKGLKSILISLDYNNKKNGLYVKPYNSKNLPIVKRNQTKMILPFNEEWTVGWGGITVKENYHVAYNNQKYAYDLYIKKEGKTYKSDSKKNENYFVFGKQIIAPCNAIVVKVIKGVKDNIPGVLNPKQVTGNTVVLKTNKGEFILFAHFKENSIRVMENQIVKQGNLLGLCGNSGNSSEPHLHLSLQNVADMNIATGGKLFFENIKVNGNLKEDYIPVKNDKIQNIKL
jgi:murein DD-endopeptidase MepM/ murein hydrolase activator NlpD